MGTRRRSSPRSPASTSSPTSKSALLLELSKQKKNNSVLASAVATRAMALSSTQHQLETLKSSLLSTQAQLAQTQHANAALRSHMGTTEAALADTQLQLFTTSSELAAAHGDLAEARAATTALKRLLLRGSPLLQILEDALVVDGDPQVIAGLRERLVERREAVEFLRGVESSGWAEEVAALEAENARLRAVIERAWAEGGVGEEAERRVREERARWEALQREFRGWVEMLGMGALRTEAPRTQREVVCMMAGRRTRGAPRPRPDGPTFTAEQQAAIDAEVERRFTAEQQARIDEEVKKRLAAEAAERRAAAENDPRVAALRQKVAAIAETRAAIHASADAEAARHQRVPELVKELLTEQTAPIIPDYDDDYFIQKWDDLNAQISGVATLGYGSQRGVPEVTTKIISKLFYTDSLFTTYAADVLLSGRQLRAAGVFFLAPVEDDEWNYGAIVMKRANLATALVYRILHEEIFEGMRNFLQMKIPDPRRTWLYKKQKKYAFIGEYEDWESNAGQLTDVTPSTLHNHVHKHMSVRDRWARDMKLWIDNLDSHDDDNGITSGQREAYRKQAKKFGVDIKTEQTKLEFLQPPERRRWNFFTWMAEKREDEEGVDGDLVAFNTTRAKMFKTLFTMQSDPLYEHMREWRARVVDLIMDTLEPLRFTAHDPATGELRKTLPPITRRDTKAAIWKIVKSAFSLAVDFCCQRDIIHTEMPRAMTEFHFNPATMVDVRFSGMEVTPALQRVVDLAEGLAAPAYFSSVAKVQCVVAPRLVRRGGREVVRDTVQAADGSTVETDRTRYRYDQERTLVKMMVYANITWAPEDLLRAENELVGLYRELSGGATGGVTDAYRSAVSEQQQRLREFDRIVRFQVEERQKNPVPFQTHIQALEEVRKQAEEVELRLEKERLEREKAAELENVLNDPDEGAAAGE